MTQQAPRSVLMLFQPGRNADLLANALRGLGHEVLTAPAGAHALRTIYESSPHLVIADISESGMCGVVEVLWLRDRVAYRPLFVVVGATPGLRDLCHTAGIDHCFTGPVQARLIDGVLQ